MALNHTCTSVNYNATNTLTHLVYLSQKDSPYDQCALSFIIYTYRNNLGRMVTDILRYPRHNAFVTASRKLVNIYVAIAIMVYLYNICTTFFISA